jgi:hypothetical protein
MKKLFEFKVRNQMGSTGVVLFDYRFSYDKNKFGWYQVTQMVDIKENRKQAKKLADRLNIIFGQYIFPEALTDFIKEEINKDSFENEGLTLIDVPEIANLKNHVPYDELKQLSPKLKAKIEASVPIKIKKSR